MSVGQSPTLASVIEEISWLLTNADPLPADTDPDLLLVAQLILHRLTGNDPDRLLFVTAARMEMSEIST